ncbi:DNA primase large subunit [Enteropsectra breve]|nr:DNA primase large subunit [Enteropsectra breve]
MRRSIRNEQRPSDISFYTEMPLSKLDYEQFRTYSSERFKMLKKLEQNVVDLSPIKNCHDDIASHACLKLVCAQAKWSSIWFVNNETKLFKYRLEKDRQAAQAFFTKVFWPHLNCHKNIESDTVFDVSTNNTTGYTPNMLVHFTKCPDLLSKRIYEVKNGYFESKNEIMISVMANEFKRHVEESIDEINGMLSFEPDERLDRIHRDLFSERTSSSGPMQDVESVIELLPLCMRGLVERLKTEKHLKYQDRQALCLFLKDIGVSLADTINFFIRYFDCNRDQFNKEYLYAIRHNYGLEGRRANYTSFTCMKLIGLGPDNSALGCPFTGNMSYAKKYMDIEDAGCGAMKCCTRYAENQANAPLSKNYSTPAEYFRIMQSMKKSDNDTKE